MYKKSGYRIKKRWLGVTILLPGSSRRRKPMRAPPGHRLAVGAHGPQYAILGKVGVEGSNPFARSSHLPHKLSPPDLEPTERPASGRFCGSGLGLITRNDTGNLSQNGVLSPELGGWPIYSTSFSSFVINGMTKWLAREVRNLFAYQTTDTRRVQMLASPSTHH
jgi:hypothetical protein